MERRAPEVGDTGCRLTPGEDMQLRGFLHSGVGLDELAEARRIATEFCREPCERGARRMREFELPKCVAEASAGTTRVEG